MAAVWYRLRAEGRRRWRAWLVLALLAGLAGGVVLAALAGARRTDTAYDRFLARANAFDVGVSGLGFPPLDLDAVSRLPQVADAATLYFAFMNVAGAADDGADVSLAPLIPADDGMFTRINRPKVLEGRRPDPDRADEVALSPLAATRYRLGVGGTVDMVAFAPEQTAQLFGSDIPDPAGPRLRFRVVGIEATPTEFLPTSPNPETVHLTPAFLRQNLGRVAMIPSKAFKLRGGEASVDAFKSDVERLSGGQPVQFVSAGFDASQVQRSIHLQAVALRVFAAVTALAAVLILGHAFARQAASDASDYPTLRAMGMSRARLWGVAVHRSAIVAAGGAVLALGLAFVVSPLSPFGIARDAEPDPGLAFDSMLPLGALALFAVAVALGAVPTWRTLRRRAGDLSSVPGGRRPSRLVERLAGLGLGAPALSGVRMAVEQERGGRGVPTRNALVSTVFCITAVVLVATFGASLQHLLGTPRLYGWDWDYLVGNPYSDDSADQVIPAVRAGQTTTGPGGPNAVTGLRGPNAVTGLRGPNAVIGLSSVGVAEVEVGRVRAIALAFTPIEGSVLPPVVEGREPRSDDEIMVGTRTLRDVGAGIGQTVTVRVGERAAEMRIVGRGLLPSITDTLDVRGVGYGALFTEPGLRRLVPEFPRNLFAVRFADGVDRASAFRELELQFGGQGPAPPKSIADFGRVDAMPAVLAGLIAVLAVATLAHTLFSVVRHRRRDLAILKMLGFVKGQVRATVASQATTLVVLALIPGIPIGIAAGRWTWRLFADSLGIVSEPIVPLAVALGIVPIAVLAANLIAAVPGGLASRVRPAAAFRSE